MKTKVSQIIPGSGVVCVSDDLARHYRGKIVRRHKNIATVQYWDPYPGYMRERRFDLASGLAMHRRDGGWEGVATIGPMTQEMADKVEAVNCMAAAHKMVLLMRDVYQKNAGRDLTLNEARRLLYLTDLAARELGSIYRNSAAR